MEILIKGMMYRGGTSVGTDSAKGIGMYIRHCTGICAQAAGLFPGKGKRDYQKNYAEYHAAGSGDYLFCGVSAGGAAISVDSFRAGRQFALPDDGDVAGPE